MRKKMVNAKYTSLDAACHQQGEKQLEKMLRDFMLPEKCPKSGCGGTRFIKHEDGYQCLNCFKIIYVKNNNGYRTKNQQLILI